MKVADFLEVVDENEFVEIYDEFEKFLTEYYGKNKTKTEFDLCEIARIDHNDNAICLYLDNNTIF